MIPGLTIGREQEAELHAVFSSWAEHFTDQLFSKGVPWLLERYAEVVDALEHQRCAHGPGGTWLTGRAWQSCCGTSYEYHDDVAVRDALALILEHAGSGLSLQAAERIRQLDDRLHALFAPGHGRGQRWWHESLPAGVVE